MDLAMITGLISELLYFLVVFGLAFALSLFFGYRVLISLILGLYLALLFYFHFPKLDLLLSKIASPLGSVIMQLTLFALITVVCRLLIAKIMPDRYPEGYFEKLGKKLILSFSVAVLVMAFSFQVLPISDLVAAGTPLQNLFAPESSFFWWLLLPIIVVYLV